METAENTEPSNANKDERENAAHRAFCAELNHELRTPLNVILGYAELLALSPGNRRECADLQQILKSARQMLAVIERRLTEPEPRSLPERGVGELARTCDLLYVEDDLINFTLVERILEYRPALSVMHAPQGKLGIEMAETYRPKLILLDLNLPDMNGTEVLQHLQAGLVTSEIPVVVLSANATPSAIERLLTAGARNYLTKPFDIDPFLAVVDEFTA